MCIIKRNSISPVIFKHIGSRGMQSAVLIVSYSVINFVDCSLFNGKNFVDPCPRKTRN